MEEELKKNFSDMLKYRVDKNYITIAVDKYSTIIMDKNGFETPEECDKVMKLLEEKIPSKRARKNKHN